MSRRLTWPFALEGGRLVTHTQDTLRDVTQCVRILLRTPAGSRPLAPDVGFDDELFGDTVESDQVVASLAEFEPRALVTVDVDFDADGRARRRVFVDLVDATTTPEAAL